MNNVVTILDCDFGDGSLEREVLANAGLELSNARAQRGSPNVDYSSIAVLSQYHPITGPFLDANPLLRAVVRYGVGLDVVDLEACKARGVRVAGVDDYCTTEVADHTVALMLSIMRSVSQADREVRAGNWPVPKELGRIRRFNGQTLGLIGMGRIATAVAHRSLAFGLDVCGFDPFLSADEIRARGVKPVDLFGALGADVVSLHLPLTDITSRFINVDTLAMFKPGSMLVNVSRGGLIDESALAQALDVGHISRAGLDVFIDETRISSIAQHPSVTATPHMAYYSEESLFELQASAAKKVVELLSNEHITFD